MAIFQPTNIIPSSFTQGTVDVNDNMEISWQVNGNSAMTGFQIDICNNNSIDNAVVSTGRITVGNLPGGSSALPFFGTDRFGNTQFFTYNAGGTWKEKGLFNGSSYKYKITQFWEKQKEVYQVSWSASSLGADRYFLVPDVGYISFQYRLNEETTFYYSISKNQLMYSNSETNNGLQEIPDFEISASVPSSGTSMGTATDAGFDYVGQSSFSAFVTRTTPTLAIYQTNSNYQNEKPLPSSLTTSIGYFQAKYQQEQDVAIRWIRWQIATVNNGVIDEILADTGDIYTPTLNYEFNGFFNGQQYAIRAVCESESEQQADTGWIFFMINIENQGRYDGKLTAKCLPNENAALVQWEGVRVIPSTVSPQGYEPAISNGAVTLAPKNASTGVEYSVSWNKEIVSENGVGKEIPMDFPTMWTAAIKYKLSLAENQETQNFELSGFPSSSTENKFYQLRVNDVGMSLPYTVKYPFPKGALRASDVQINVVVGSNASYTIDETNREVAVTVHASRGGSIFATVTISYYFNKVKFTRTVPGAVASVRALPYSSNLLDFDLSYKKNIVTVTLYSNSTQATAVSLTIIVAYYKYFPLGKLLEIKGNDIQLNAIDDVFIIALNNENRLSFTRPENADSVAIILTPAFATAVFYDGTQCISQPTEYIALNDWQLNVKGISVFGGDTGSTIDSVSVFKGNGNEIPAYYADDYKFEPVWNSDNYQLYMSANFNGNLEGGTGSVNGNGFRVYRQEVGKNVLTPIATVKSTITSLKDYGIVSRKAYKYSVHVYDNNNAFMSATETENVIATSFKNYSLIVCDYYEATDEYHVLKQYIFALNLSSGSVSNNNSPALNKNFTPYPTKMSDTANYASGTLQGLIGAIRTVPAQIERTENYEWTAKPSTIDYFDNIDLEKELYDLSVTPYTLFLRDMKGHLRMVVTSGAISMTTNIKQKQQAISISLPWAEIGDASDVTIIQTPDDYGWDSGNKAQPDD